MAAAVRAVSADPAIRLVNDGFGLDGFKHIFWLEWTHRLWGRLIGVVFLVPLVWLGATGRIERRLLPRLALLFVLGGLQGAVGWFMVASGFLPEATAVSAVPAGRPSGAGAGAVWRDHLDRTVAAASGQPARRHAGGAEGDGLGLPGDWWR